MRIHLPAGILLLLFSGLLGPTAKAQDFHEFTDKKGQKIMAALLTVSADRRLMKIRREDGQEFETQINVLSLDDQQYIKDWMREQADSGNSPTVNDFRLEVSIDRKSIGTEKHKSRDGYTVYEQRMSLFEISVQNLSRETLPPFRVEYAIVWRDVMTVYEDKDDGEMTYSYDEDDAEAKLLGEVEVGALPFNREEILTTVPYEINRMIFIGDTYREDAPYGIIARVVAADGTVLAEERDGTSDLDSYTWEEAVALPDPRVED